MTNSTKDDEFRYNIAKALHGEPKYETIWGYGSKEAVWKDVSNSDEVFRLAHFINQYANQREKKALQTIASFPSDSMLELREYAGRRINEIDREEKGKK